MGNLSVGASKSRGAGRFHCGDPATQGMASTFRQRICPSPISLQGAPGLCYNPSSGGVLSAFSPYESPPSMNATPKTHRGPWTFVAVFACCALGLLGGYRYTINTVASDGYLYAVSRHTTWILNAIGEEAVLEKTRAQGVTPWESWRDRASTRPPGDEDGPRVSFVLKPGAPFTFIVVPSCGAIEVMAIFVAAVLAFPATWRHRARGIALGLPLMYLINIARLAFLACLGALDKSGKWFNFVHEYVWQAAYVIVVVIIWMAWAELGRERNTP